MTTDAHSAGLTALVNVAEAATGALKSATDDLKRDPKRASKMVTEQSILLSKALSALGKRLDQMPAPDRTPPDGGSIGPTVCLPDIRTALDRLHSASQNGLCDECGGVTPQH